ncbi:FimV/HubP family polar landmark protein [Candidatus Nitrotoga sp. AM1P]|uniref:FimV/HubP family polar landmark protein n=1 Tax=Candidatus Nitrotoga sp. AM1P TaxID=2559597 RepID=UPI0010B0385C|nr:FimV/HubP family polar landmark protein [Candidatus Nitrotoga sp. AM1P]BBJ23353.1 motility protein FimV [Candidatus Nitrotoga sp. AM1P]
MLKSLVKALGLAIGLVLSGFSYAISMGDINVTNTLGEPMNVLIELGTASKDEISSLSARLASPEVFKNAGLDYPSGLPPLNFKIETNANGEPYIKITSAQPINEPFVNLLVELAWSSGKLLREYTFLLDPPGYVPVQPQPAEVKPVEPSIVDVSELESKGKEEIIESPLPSTALMVDEKQAVDEIPAAVNKPNESSNVASGAIKVKRGDTLSKLALQIKSPDVSLERALVALYRTNADAFDGKNMNRLKIGKILQMPEQSELDNLPQMQAVKEIRAQADDWHAYRQKLAAASGLVTGDESKQEASGKISTTVSDNAPATKESAKEVVRLSKGEAPGDKTSAGGNAKTLQNKLHALEEEAISKSKALQESNERVVALEKNVQDLQRLIDLKGQPPVAQVKSVQNPVEEQAVTKSNEDQLGAMSQVPAVTSQVANVASEVAAVSAVAAVSPVQQVKPITKPKVVVTQPSLLEVIRGQPLYMAGGAAALLGLVGLGYLVTRRGKNSGKKTKLGDKPIEHTIGSSNQMLTPASSSPKTDDSTNAIATTSDISQAQADDFDPISGADLFLSFGRDEQAEKILKEALIKNPANHQIHLKLLSIYANRKDVHLFATIARQLRDSGDTHAWEQAAVMGIKLEPNNPMYGGNVSVTEEEPFVATHSPDIMLNEGGAAKPPSSLDFDLDLDFDAPKALTDSAETSKSSSVSKNTTMDFDVTASHAKLPASSTGKVGTTPINLDDFILDVAANPAIAPAMTTPTKVNEPIDFTLDFPSADKSADKFEVSPVKAVPKEIMDIGLGDISLNLDKPVIPAPALSVEERDAQWHDAATKLDLAKAYQEMGDAAGAREILEEVVREGNEQHRMAAEALLRQLPV